MSGLDLEGQRFTHLKVISCTGRSSHQHTTSVERRASLAARQAGIFDSTRERKINLISQWDEQPPTLTSGRGRDACDVKRRP